MARQILNLGSPTRGEGLPGAESRYEAFRKTDENFAELYGPVGIVARTASGTLALAEAEQVVEVTSASGVTISVPTDAAVAFPVGTTITVRQCGAGAVTIAAVTPGTTTLRAPGSLVTKGQWASVTLQKRAANDWVVEGHTTA